LASSQQALGIDVSHYKNQIDWNRVQESGLTFAIIKATEGNNFIDSRFDYNWTRARRVDMIRGAYHFFRPLVDPVSQAHHYLRIVGKILDKTDLPPVLDVEVFPDFIKNEYKKISTSERQQRVRVWLQTIETATGRTPMIYTDYYTWRDYLGNTEAFARYPLWIAAYKVERPKIPANNWGGKGWTFWQYTNKGVVPGIRDEAACVDMDYYQGDLDGLRSWLKITKQRPLPPSLANGDMMAAIIDAAESMGASSDEWVSITGLRYLVDPIGNSLRPYDGPAVEDLPLEKAEQAALSSVLEEFSVNFAALGITHQDMINAIYYAASLENLGGWSLVLKAGIGYIGDDRDQVYEGPGLEELPGLTQSQKGAIAAYLGVELIGDDQEEDTAASEDSEELPAESEAVDPGLPPTYSPDLTNQAMINAFHLMALELDGNGQVMIAAAGLEDLGDARNTVYSGPKIEDLPGLTWDIKLHLAGLLNVVIVLPNAEIKVEGVEDPEVEPEGAALETELETEPEAEPEAEPPSVQEEVPVPVVDPAAEAPQVEAPIYDAMEDENFLELVDQLPVVDITGSDEPDEPKEERSWLPIITNQEVIEAFFQVAERVGREGWSLLEQAGLLDLDIDRAERFTGLAAEKLEEIGTDVADLVVEVLGVGSKKSLTKKSASETGQPYPGMVNLDMVNLFYKAASHLGESGQQWLMDSGMSYLNKSRVSRFKPYLGPEIPEMLKLSQQQRLALQAALEDSARENSPGLD
jgi:lysozyme